MEGNELEFANIVQGTEELNIQYRNERRQGVGLFTLKVSESVQK
jgi:hypothetical protein